MERTLDRNERAYKNLEAVAKILEATSENSAHYVVQNTYLDYGLGWEWTTICRKGYRECQVLNPNEWEVICLADSIEALAQAAKNVKNGKYFND